MRSVFLALLAFTVSVSAQTWYTPDPTRLAEQKVKVEGAFLVVHAPITVLPPPKIASLKVAWDRITANWTIILQSKDGASTLTLVPKTYEQAVTLRDALIRLHRLTPQQVTSEDQAAEKQRG